MSVTIKLLYRYETGLFGGDYSRGIFLVGKIDCQEQETQEIVDKFLNTGEIELFECTNKYISDEISEEKHLIQFMNKDVAQNFNNVAYRRINHAFGHGFVNVDKFNYKHYYWLSIKRK